MERGKTALKICSWTNAERPVTAISPMALVASTGQRLPDGARRRRRLNTDWFDGCCPLRPSTSMTPPPITATPRSFPLPGPGANMMVALELSEIQRISADGCGRPSISGLAVGAFDTSAFPPPSDSIWEESMYTWLGLPPRIDHHR
jgi:hypothetical protein